MDQQGGEERECLARQVVTLLQQLAQRSCIQDVSTQTSPAEVSNQATRTFTSPKELGTISWDSFPVVTRIASSIQFHFSLITSENLLCAHYL